MNMKKFLRKFISVSALLGTAVLASLAGPSNLAQANIPDHFSPSDDIKNVMRELVERPALPKNVVVEEVAVQKVAPVVEEKTGLQTTLIPLTAKSKLGKKELADLGVAKWDMKYVTAFINKVIKGSGQFRDGDALILVQSPDGKQEILLKKDGWAKGDSYHLYGEKDLASSAQIAEQAVVSPDPKPEAKVAAAKVKAEVKPKAEKTKPAQKVTKDTKPVSADEQMHQIVNLKPGQTVHDLLGKHGIKGNLRKEIYENFNRVFPPSNLLKAGQAFKIVRDKKGKVVSFSFVRKKTGETVLVYPLDEKQNKFAAKIIEPPTDGKDFFATGTIGKGGNLFKSLTAKGLSADLAMQAIDLLSRRANPENMAPEDTFDVLVNGSQLLGLRATVQGKKYGFVRTKLKGGHSLFVDDNNVALLDTFSLPVGRLSSGFGPRIHPITGKKGFHFGADFAAPKGTPVKAVMPGRVVVSKYIKGYGNVVTVDCGFGLLVTYAHLQAKGLKAGTMVESGQNLGKVGSTGRSTGNHLHLEFRLWGKAINPLTFNCEVTVHKAAQGIVQVARKQINTAKTVFLAMQEKMQKRVALLAKVMKAVKVKATRRAVVNAEIAENVATLEARANISAELLLPNNVVSTFMAGAKTGSPSFMAKYAELKASGETSSQYAATVPHAARGTLSRQKAIRARAFRL